MLLYSSIKTTRCMRDSTGFRYIHAHRVSRRTDRNVLLIVATVERWTQTCHAENACTMVHVRARPSLQLIENYRIYRTRLVVTIISTEAESVPTRLNGGHINGPRGLVAAIGADASSALSRSFDSSR